MMPFTKCFWMKGYISITGTEETMITEYFRRLARYWRSIMFSTMPAVISLKSKLFITRICRSTSCSGNLLCVRKYMSAPK